MAHSCGGQGHGCLVHDCKIQTIRKVYVELIQNQYTGTERKEYSEHCDKIMLEDDGSPVLDEMDQGVIERAAMIGRYFQNEAARTVARMNERESL